MSTSTDRQTLDLPDLKSRIRGRVVEPEDADYDDVRTAIPTRGRWS